MMKKHLVEGVVPVLIELKRSLEGLRHWLLGDLLTCIRALLKDHKNEVPYCENSRQRFAVSLAPVDKMPCWLGSMPGIKLSSCSNSCWLGHEASGMRSFTNLLSTKGKPA